MRTKDEIIEYYQYACKEIKRCGTEKCPNSHVDFMEVVKVLLEWVLGEETE